MRNYTNTLLFESALDSIPSTNVALYNTAFRLFNPVVIVVEEDCGTLLGTPIPVDFKAEGYIELDNGLPINRATISSLALSNSSYVNTRSAYSCISKNGVCNKCLSASKPRLSIVTGNMYQVNPELIISVNTISISTGLTTYSLPYDVSQYDTLYIYDDGILVSQATYSVSGSTLTLSSSPGSTKTLLLKFGIFSNVGFYYWLANTYSGSLLGIKSLIDLPLPIKPSLLSSFINEDEIDLLIQALKQTDIADQDFVTYIPSIKDPLEKAIFVVTLCSIFLN
jgi:hypothetical protein